MDIFKKTGEQIEEEMCAKFTELTDIVLYPTDLTRLTFKVIAYMFFLVGKLINYKYQQCFLKFADEDHIHLHGYGKNVVRNQPQKSVTTLRFFRDVTGESLTIPFGTKATDGTLVFSTTKTLSFEPLATYLDVPIECTLAGKFGDDILPGQINKLINILPYITKVENITKTTGGADLESIESYREGIRTKPESYSVAGPKGAYIYHAKRADTTIRDVFPHEPTEGVVELFCLNNESVPLSSEVKERALKYLRDGELRPLTDNVIISDPSRKDYSLEFTYYLPKSLEVYSSSISDKVNTISENFIKDNQRLGKDIVLDDLIILLKKEGVKRIETSIPYYLKVDDKSYAVGTIPVNGIKFGGAEDD